MYLQCNNIKKNNDDGFYSNHICINDKNEHLDNDNKDDIKRHDKPIIINENSSKRQ